jgi:DNA-binding NtrC family response regulator
MARLRDYDWPGNIRELRNVLEQAVISSPNHVLQLPKGFDASSSQVAPTTPANGFNPLEAVEKTRPESPRRYRLANQRAQDLYSEKYELLFNEFVINVPFPQQILDADW